MSKIAILKSLPTPADLRHSVSQIQQALDKSSERLDSTAKQVQELSQLPQLVAEQVSESLRALDPILSMRQDVQTALEAFDQVSLVQRQTLEALAQELSSQAAQTMEAKTASLSTTLESVTQNTSELLRGLKVSMDLMSEAVSKVQKMPSQLESDLSDSVMSLKNQAAALKKAGDALKTETDRARARPRWKVLGELVAVAVVAALFVVAGQVVLNKLLLPSDAKIWAKATDKEKAYLNQIASRPAQ